MAYGMNSPMSKEEAVTALHDLNAEHARKANELLAIIDSPKRTGLWKPKQGAEYWTLDSGGEAFGAMATYKTSARAAHGLVFPSKDIAQKAAPLLARSNKWIAAAFQADPDAGEWAEDRNWTVWDDRGILTTMTHWFAYGREIYVHTREQSEEMKRILLAEGLGK